MKIAKRESQASHYLLQRSRTPDALRNRRSNQHAILGKDFVRNVDIPSVQQLLEVPPRNALALVGHIYLRSAAAISPHGERIRPHGCTSVVGIPDVGPRIRAFKCAHPQDDPEVPHITEGPTSEARSIAVRYSSRRSTVHWTKNRQL